MSNGLSNEDQQHIVVRAIHRVLAEARKGALAAPSNQRLTYTGGLRRAAKILDDLLGELYAEKPGGGETVSEPPTLCEREFGFLGAVVYSCTRPYGHSGNHTREGVSFSGARNAEDERRTESALDRRERTEPVAWDLDSLLDCVRDDLHPEQIRSLLREAYDAGRRWAVEALRAEAA